MGVIGDIQQKVSEIAEEREMAIDQAFAYWFLEDIEELSQEEAEATVVGGPWDQGRDAVYDDLESNTLKVYQMKYSESRAYVLDAFSDLQRGLIAEYDKDPNRFKQLQAIELKLVTKYSADAEFHAARTRQQKRIRNWLTRKGLYDLSRNTVVEIFDLTKFAQLLERLYGVQISLAFREPPIESNGTLLGLVDARAFRDHIHRDELLAFNIRKFLGVRRGSVNAKIKDTLEDDTSRKRFWIYNNGIVCLFTAASQTEDPTKRDFSDFTIVNGAQTVSTIATFLDENPIVVEAEEPIWVVAKIIRVDGNDLDMAVALTQTSNTQTPASGRDLRAVDIGHSRLQAWMSGLGYTYVYKRGGKVPRGAPVVQMKDVAQAYVAFWHGLPHVSFARAGSIFGNNDLYDLVFPADVLDALHESGSTSEQLAFATQRLMPAQLLAATRRYIASRVTAGDDRMWKSLTYHMLYAYSVLLADFAGDSSSLIGQIDKILEVSADNVYGSLKDLVQFRSMAMPRDLKTDTFLVAMASTSWADSTQVKNAQAAIRHLLQGEEG